MDFKEWFIAERARALAMVLLTRRDDLSIEESKDETGLDYTAHIRADEEPGKRAGLHFQIEA